MTYFTGFHHVLGVVQALCVSFGPSLCGVAIGRKMWVNDKDSGCPPCFNLTALTGSISYSGVLGKMFFEQSIL